MGKWMALEEYTVFLEVVPIFLGVEEIQNLEVQTYFQTAELFSNNVQYTWL